MTKLFLKVICAVFEIIILGASAPAIINMIKVPIIHSRCVKYIKRSRKRCIFFSKSVRISNVYAHIKDFPKYIDTISME